MIRPRSFPALAALLAALALPGTAAAETEALTDEEMGGLTAGLLYQVGQMLPDYNYRKLDDPLDRQMMADQAMYSDPDYCPAQFSEGRARMAFTVLASAKDTADARRVLIDMAPRLARLAARLQGWGLAVDLMDLAVAAHAALDAHVNNREEFLFAYIKNITPIIAGKAGGAAAKRYLPKLDKMFEGGEELMADEAIDGLLDVVGAATQEQVKAQLDRTMLRKNLKKDLYAVWEEREKLKAYMESYGRDFTWRHEQKWLQGCTSKIISTLNLARRVLVATVTTHCACDVEYTNPPYLVANRPRSSVLSVRARLYPATAPDGTTQLVPRIVDKSRRAICCDGTDKDDSQRFAKLEFMGGQLGEGATLRVTVRRQEGRKISGRVRDRDGKPVAGARVQLALGGTVHSGTSGSEGLYTLSIPKDAPLPGEVILRADKDGFDTATRGVEQNEFQSAHLILSQQSDDVMVIDPNLYHLGDSSYSGTINSQFQRPNAQGKTHRATFRLPPQRLARAAAGATAIRLTVKGAQRPNPVRINGKKAFTIASAKADGGAVTRAYPFDACSLRQGENTLTVTSSANADGDLDDFEIANIQLVFGQEAGKSVQADAPAKLSSLAIMDPGFTRVMATVDPDGQFAIQAQGKGDCTSLPDQATVEVLSGGGAPRSTVVHETGADTGVFRSREALNVADLDATPGERIVVRSGLRGASARVAGGQASGATAEEKPQPSGKRPEEQEQVRAATTHPAEAAPDTAPPPEAGTGNDGGETIAVNQGNRRLKAGVRPQKTYLFHEQRCDVLAPLAQAVAEGEKPRLVRRVYRTAGDETFEMIERSGQAALHDPALDVDKVRGFLSFKSARDALDELVDTLACPRADTR